MRFSFLLLAVVLTACGASKSDDPAPVDASTKEKFIAAYCSRITPCCAGAQLPTDGVQCNALLTAFMAPTYDEANGRQCLEDMQSASVGANLCNQTSTGSTLACRKVFQRGTGAAKVGEACNEDGDCAIPDDATTTSRCAAATKDGTTVKKCQLLRPGKAGDGTCVGDVDGDLTVWVLLGAQPDQAFTCDRKQGLYCNAQIGSAVCTKQGDVGQKCTGGLFGSSCLSTAYCDPDNETCAARKSPGSHCAFDEECTSSNCDKGICKERLVNGADCTSNSECYSGSCVNFKCDKMGEASKFGLTLLCGS